MTTGMGAAAWLLGMAFAAGAGETRRELTARQVDVGLPEMPAGVARADAAWMGNGADIVIDGNLEDWPADAAWIDVGAIEDAADLSATVAVAISGHGFYLAADVRDDAHWNREGGERIWMGDSVQFALDPMGDRAAGGYSWDDHEIGIALTETGPLIWRWQRPSVYPMGEIRSADVAIVRDEEGGTTRYELRISYAALYPLEPAILPWCGFTIAVNDGDRGRRDVSLLWTPGLTEGKNPALFGVLRFPGEEIRRSTAYAVCLEGPADPVPAGVGEIWSVRVYAANEAYPDDEFTIGVAADVETGPAIGTCWWVDDTEMPRGASRWMLAPNLEGVAPARMLVTPRCGVEAGDGDGDGVVRLTPSLEPDTQPASLVRKAGLVTYVYER